jgi:hypothetical protein
MKKKTYAIPVTMLIPITPHTLLAGSQNVLSSDGKSLPVSPGFDEDDINNAI